MKKKFLTGKDLCPLPKSNEYSKITINQLAEQDPKYFLWMIKNCLAWRYSLDIRQKANKLKKNEIKS